MYCFKFTIELPSPSDLLYQMVCNVYRNLKFQALFLYQKLCVVLGFQLNWPVEATFCVEYCVSV